MLQRMRNRITIFGMAGLILGVGMSLVFSFAPSLVAEHTARVLAYVGFGLIALGVVLFIYGFWKTPAWTMAKLYEVNPILEKMEQRLLELAEKEKGKKFNVQTYIELNEEINTGLLDITTAKTETVEETRNFVLKIESLIREKYGEQATNISRMLSKLHEISLILDNRGFGLKRQRRKDKEYRKLTRTLSYYRNFTPPELNELIKEHKISAEIEANMILVKYRGLEIKAKVEQSEYSAADFMSLPRQARLEGLELLMAEFMSQIRAVIIECIRDLEEGHGNNKSEPTTKQ